MDAALIDKNIALSGHLKESGGSDPNNSLVSVA